MARTKTKPGNTQQHDELHSLLDRQAAGNQVAISKAFSSKKNHSRLRSLGKEALEEATSSSTQVNLDEEESDHEDDSDTDLKDAEEEDLERAVFGDSVGFREELQAFRSQDQDATALEDAEKYDQDGDVEEDVAGLEGLQDADVRRRRTLGQASS